LANATSVDVFYDFSNGATVRVDIAAQHRNNFAGIVGMPTWTVATTATALTGIPDTVTGGGPLIFSVDVFGTDGEPLPQYADPSVPYSFGETNNDAPDTPGDFAWTNYGTGTVDSDRVREIIEGDLVISKTIQFGEYIGQSNEGNHTTLYGDVQAHLVGEDIPVQIVDHNGIFQGWATFHVVSADGSSDKNVRGYFVSPFLSQHLSVGCASGSCPRYLGSYVLKLID
jgi:hypothetical protein